MEDLFNGDVTPDPERVFRNSSWTNESPFLDLDEILLATEPLNSPVENGTEIIIVHKGRGQLIESYLGVVEDGKYRPLAEITMSLVPDRVRKDKKGNIIEVIETNRGYSCEATKLSGSCDVGFLFSLGNEYAVHVVPPVLCKMLKRLGEKKNTARRELLELDPKGEAYNPKEAPLIEPRILQRGLPTYRNNPL